MDRIEFYTDAGDKWRWRLRASNGRILADSGQGYSRRVDAVRACGRVTGCRIDVDKGAAWAVREVDTLTADVTVTA